jgi:hypothetical protein
MSNGMADHSILHKATGKHLLMPSAWGTQIDVNDEEVIPVIYEFKKVTPVKKFRLFYLKK